MLDPIEIDINMRQNVSEESDKASQGIVAIGEAAAKATKEIQAQIEQQMAVITKMSKSLEELEKKSSIDSPSLDPALMDATLGHIQNLKKLLAEAREELSQMQTDTGSLSSTVSMLVGQYESIGEAIKTMAADGKSGTDSIRALEMEQSLLIDSIGSIGAESDKAISKVGEVGSVTHGVFTQSKKDIQDQAGAIDSMQDKMGEAGNTTEKVFEASISRSKDLRAEIDLQKQKLRELAEEQTSAFNTLESAPDNDASRPQLENEFNALTQTLKDQRAVLKSLKTEYEGTLKAIADSTQSTVQSVESSLSKGLGSDAIKISVKDVEKTIDDLKSKYSSAANTFSQALGDDGLENKTQAYKKYIDELRNLYKELSSSVDFTKNSAAIDPQFEASYKTLKQLLTDVNKEIKQEFAALTEIEKAQSGVSNSSDTYVTKLRKIQEEMARLRSEGKETSADYTKLRDTYISLSQDINSVKIDNKIGSGLKGTLEGITGFSGVLTAGTGVLGLLNQKSEDFAKIQTRVQSLMSATIGLQQMSNLANKQGAFYVTAITKAKQLLASTSTLVASGIGAIVVGVGIAVLAYREWHKSQIEANKRLKEEKQLLRESASSIQENVSKVQILDKVLKDSNRTYDERNNALKQLKSIMPEYNAQLTKEGKLIEDNTGALQKYIRGLLNVEMAKGAITKLAVAQTALDTFKDSLTDLDKAILHPSEADQATFDKYKAHDDERIARLRKQESMLQEEVNRLEKTAQKYITSDDAAYKDNTQAYWESQQANALNRLKAMEDWKKGSKEWNAVQADYDLATTKLKTWDIKGQHKADAKAETEAQKKAKKEKEANEKLEKKAYDYQKRIDAARVAAMQDGADQQRAAVKAEYDQTKAYIAQELKDIAELEAVTGKPATVERTRLNDLNTAAAAQFEAETNKINTVAKKVLDDIFADVNSKFKSELDNNLDTINSYYDDTIKEARKAGATITEINELNAARDKEIELAKNESRIESIQFEAEIAERRMAISNKFYVFEADKLKEQLTMQQEAAQKRLDLLNKQYAKTPTDELANEIKLATIEVDEMGAAMKKLPAQKFGEIAAMVSNIAGGLGDLFGEDSSLGKAAGWISDLGSAAADIATGTPQGIISGVLKTANVVKSVIATNKQANKEIKEFRDNLANMAVEYSITLINALKDIEGVNDSLFNKDISNTLTRGMEGYNAAIAKQGQLMAQLGSVTIKTGVKKKKFLGITTGTKDIYSSLLKTYPDLIKADGELNRELADTLLQSGNLSKEATNLVNNIIKAADAAEAAMEQVNSMLESVAGSIGDDLRNALTDAFRNGTSEAETFGKAVSKILEDLVSQMVFSAVFGEKLKELEDRMKESYSPGGDQNLTDDIAWFYKTYGTDVSKFNEALQAAKDAAAKEGIDLFSNSNRTGASAPGLATASQESISALTGGIYAVRQMLGDIRNMQAEELLIKQTISNQMIRLIENTEFCRYLENIDESLRAMKRNVNVKMV